MFFRQVFLIYGIAGILALSACSEYQKVLKSNDPG